MSEQKDDLTEVEKVLFELCLMRLMFMDLI